jgi:hypothetical protein
MPTKKQKFELLKAHHEAGHGVIARKLGIPVRRLTIFSADDDSEASALTESASYIARDADQATFVAAIENDVRVCLAGPHAQSRYQPPDGSNPAEWEGDRETATALAVKATAILRGVDVSSGIIDPRPHLDEAEVALLFQRLSKEAAVLVAENWPAITRVAKALVKRRELTGKELDDLIARAM